MDHTCICNSKDLFNFGCRCQTQGKMYVFYNGIDWVVAETADHAREVLREWSGIDDECLDGDEGWSKLADDEMLAIRDGPDDDSITRLTAKEWVEECGGDPQPIGSREY